MDSNQHTPEPWEVDVICPSAVRGNGDHVASCYGSSDANARHIVACVNFCTGRTDVELAALLDMGGLAQLTKNYADCINKRDALVAALRGMMKLVDEDMPFTGRTYPEISVARNALAKVSA